jgi:hypothetical protein
VNVLAPLWTDTAWTFVGISLCTCVQENAKDSNYGTIPVGAYCETNLRHRVLVPHAYGHQICVTLSKVLFRSLRWADSIDFYRTQSQIAYDG